MKRKKRILAGAAAMLLALGMLIGCDTPANSGSSDGGNVGGDITLPEGDSSAKNKLVGTWVYEEDYTETLELKTDGTCISDQKTGTWSATDTVLSVKIPASSSIQFHIDLDNNDCLSIQELEIRCSRESGSRGAIEGKWSYSETYGDGTKINITLVITADSFTITQTDVLDMWRRITEHTGIREDNTLTGKNMFNMATYPYSLSNYNTTLIWGGYGPYTRQ